MADRLREARLKKAADMGVKLTQEDVAAATNVSRSHVANAEGAKTGISLDAAYALAQFYDVSLDYLTGLSIAPLQSPGGVFQNPEERTLIRSWRAMDEAERVALAIVIDRLGAKASPSDAA
ncbi:helix-turn-helix transcriptional regulator [Acetobacter oeni]|nr:helix-turn-helix transcriptional regulator [Acetobacter oeni]MBB3883394.1 transcriptional regulator with XRE-family HTH domain [Acetobacter oeni]